MLITKATKYKDFQGIEKYVSEKSIQALYAGAEKQFGGMYDLEFGSFWECSNGNFEGVLGDMQEPTVLQVYWMKRFEKFVEEFAEQLKGLTITPNADEQRASAGMLKVGWAEAMLIFLKDYFGLHNFKDAERITIGEILIAKRAAYNRDTFQRNLAAINKQKMRRK
jgi:hypothetical protein